MQNPPNSRLRQASIEEDAGKGRADLASPLSPTGADRHQTVSVCIPTYNGEPHLWQQLESLRAQTRPPDEILVGDDCSTDGTLKLVEEFASHSSIPVRVLASERNIGLCDNVRRLVKAASSEVICFCDQDDIWLPSKVETLLRYLDDPRVDAVCCDSRPFDSSSGRTYEETVWEILLKGDSPRAAVDVLWNKNFMSGHNIAIRRDVMLRYLWPAGTQVFYDYWIALITSAKGTMALCPEVLTLYRQHDDNFIGLGGRRGTSRDVRNWTMTADTLDGVLEFLGSEAVRLDAARAERMRERSRFVRIRSAYRHAPIRHFATPLQLALSKNGYFAFGNGWYSFLGDLLVLGDPRGRLRSRFFSRPRARGRRPDMEHGDDGASRLRLGVYADLSYRRDGEGVSTTTAFVSWLSQLADAVDELVLFGRVDPIPGRSPFELAASNRVRFVEMPFYPSLHDLWAVTRAVLPSWRRWHRELSSCDAVLVFGPHPLSTLFELDARASRIPVFVGVRENLSDYLQYRTRGWRSRIAGPAARAMQQAHLRLASAGALVVGDEMADFYRSRGVTVLQSGISLLRQSQFSSPEEIEERVWPGSSTILVVGRLDPVKNPRLLLDVAAALMPRGCWNIEVVGTGSMADDLRREAAERGLTNLIFHGRLPRDRLMQLYLDRATVFLHVSLTEGQPQVLYEAAAFGVPIIATSVGGVPSALAHGKRGLLVPPRDPDAVLRAIEQLDRDPARRRELVAAARHWSFEETIDVQTREVASFIRSQLGRSEGTSPSS